MPIDYSEYPPNWFTEIRPRILARAGQVIGANGDLVEEAVCEWCGVKNHQPRNGGSMVVLTIAHIDHDKENFEVADDRLAALCQSCHLKYDAPRHHEKRRQRMDREKGQLQLIAPEESMDLVQRNHYLAGRCNVEENGLSGGANVID